MIALQSMQSNRYPARVFAALDARDDLLYLTYQLFNRTVQFNVSRSPQRHFRGSRRSDPTRNSRAPRARRNLGAQARRAIRDEPAGRLEAPQGAGTRRADYAHP